MNAKQHVDSGYLKVFKYDTVVMQSSMFEGGVQFWFDSAHIEFKTSELRGREDEQLSISATSAIIYSLHEYLKFGNLTVNSPIVTLVVDDQVEAELTGKWFELKLVVYFDISFCAKEIHFHALF